MIATVQTVIATRHIVAGDSVRLLVPTRLDWTPAMSHLVAAVTRTRGTAATGGRQ